MAAKCRCLKLTLPLPVLCSGTLFHICSNRVHQGKQKFVHSGKTLFASIIRALPRIPWQEWKHTGVNTSLRCALSVISNQKIMVDWERKWFVVTAAGRPDSGLYFRWPTSVRFLNEVWHGQGAFKPEMKKSNRLSSVWNWKNANSLHSGSWQQIFTQHRIWASRLFRNGCNGTSWSNPFPVISSLEPGKTFWPQMREIFLGSDPSSQLDCTQDQRPDQCVLYSENHLASKIHLVLVISTGCSWYCSKCSVIVRARLSVWLCGRKLVRI